MDVFVVLLSKISLLSVLAGTAALAMLSTLFHRDINMHQHKFKEIDKSDINQPFI